MSPPTKILPLLMIVCACMGPARSIAIEKETAEFWKKHAPHVLKMFEEVEKAGDEDDAEEARERAEGLREEYLEAKEEGGEAWAKLVLGREIVEIEVEYLFWKFERDEISEDEGEKKLRAVLKKRIKLDLEIDKMEVKALRREADEIERDIRERESNAEEELEGLFEEVLEERGFEEGEDEDEHEEEEEEEEGDDELGGPVYTPPPANREQTDELAGVGFGFAKHIKPALEQYCFDCHDRDSAKGDIDLESALAQTPLVRNRLLWKNVAERVRNGDMPPKKETQPTATDRLRVRAWLRKEIDEFDYASVRNPGHIPARRLTREEYNRTIRDLVGLDLRPADEFPMDFSGTSGFSNSANTLFLQTAHLDRYMTAADGVIDSVRGDAEAWKKLSSAGSSKETLTDFLRRAYRRPPTDSEIADAMGRYEKGVKAGKDRRDALADAFKFVLVSPSFLLRVEAESKTGADAPVAGHDLASRLSYFLWSSMPDDALLAEASRLTDSAVRRAQVERMLADPRSMALGEIFAAEWLSTDDVGPRIRKDPIDNPWCTETLMAAMRNETALFFHSLVRENAPVEQLLNAEYTFLNAELAKFYRIPGISGDRMRRVSLKTSTRGGLLGQAAVLTTTSFPDRTSPVVRGNWILATLLGTPPPPPPPDVPEVDVDGGGKRAARTLRRKLEAHRESPQCAGCHDQIDPLGFALESYSEFGKWRSGVDNRGTLPNGATFRGLAGLRRALTETRLDDLGAQVIRRMLAYALGRQLEYYDEGVVREIAGKLKPAGYPLKDLVFEIVDSYPFTTKRVPAS